MLTLLDHGAYRSRCHLTCALLIAGALVSVSCSDSSTPTNPTTFGMAGTSSTSNASISALSDNIVAQPVSNAFCPTVAPFSVPFVVVVNGAPDLVVTRFQLQFTDSVGMHMPTVTVPAPVPIQEFGTELTNARDLRFPLTLGVGCGVGRSGVLVVGFDGTDHSGHKSTGQVKITVN